LNKKGRKMAKKPVKKAVAKKAPAKKAPVKKAVVKKAPVAKAAVAETKVVMEAPATCAAGCCCGKKSCGFCRFVRKLIVFFVIFALGYSFAMYCPYGRHFMHHGPRMEEMFVNGCLDTAKMPNPDMAEKIKAADANNDGCITHEEFAAGRDEAREEVRAEMPKPEMAKPARPEMPAPAGKTARR